ncbi:MAG: hypothetical protein HY671_13560 [Chloroflexi bacterium]|nr:hypothetical protein [Chloroflexota bacterium]
MAKPDKLLSKARNSPYNISFQELETLAARYGLPLQPGGSHYVQRLPDGTKNTIKREGDKVKKWYVQEVVEAIDTFGKTREEAKDE